MTPEEIEALKAEAKAAKEAAETYKAAAEQAQMVNATLQDELKKSNERAKESTTKLTVKVGKKKGEIQHGCNHNGTIYTAQKISESKDEDFLLELVAAEVIKIID